MSKISEEFKYTLSLFAQPEVVKVLLLLVAFLALCAGVGFFG